MDLENYLQNNSKTHLIFDFDNTLAQLQIDWSKWGEEIQNKLIELDPYPWKKYQDNAINLSQLQNHYIRSFGNKIKDEIIKHSIWLEINCSGGAKPNSKLISLIPRLDKYQKFIWTSNTRQGVEPILENFEVKKYFEKIITRNDVSLLKPEIEGFELIYDKKTPLKNYLFIGDSGSDKKAAKTIGIDFYKVNYFGLNLDLD